MFTILKIFPLNQPFKLVAISPKLSLLACRITHNTRRDTYYRNGRSEKFLEKVFLKISQNSRVPRSCFK